MSDGGSGLHVQRAVDHLRDHVGRGIQHVLVIGAAVPLHCMHEEAGSFPK